MAVAVEKPVAPTLEGMEAGYAACEAAGVGLGTGYVCIIYFKLFCGSAEAGAAG